jgi:hypothetical protein
LAGAAVLLAGFLLVETRSRAPLVPLQGLVTRVGPRPIAALSMALPRGSLGDRQRLARDREALVEEMAQMSDERPAAAR